MDGWTITHDPLILPLGRRKLHVDTGAEAPIAAEKAGRQIAVEIKSFAGVSEVTELERAFGQYVMYRFLLGRHEPGRILYLALPMDAYASLFNEQDERELAQSQDIHFLVFDPLRREIIQWIP